MHTQVTNLLLQVWPGGVHINIQLAYCVLAKVYSGTDQCASGDEATIEPARSS